MYFVMKGTCKYKNDHLKGVDKVHVCEGQWFAEPNLWTTWVYHGTISASTDSKLAVLDAGLFQDIVSRFTPSRSSCNPKTYAAEFVAFLNESEDHNDISVMKNYNSNR
jgi:hypothetical protein